MTAVLIRHTWIGVVVQVFLSFKLSVCLKRRILRGDARKGPTCVSLSTTGEDVEPLEYYGTYGSHLRGVR